VTKESSAEVTRFCRGEPGYRGLDDRPWLAGERPWRSSLDSPPPELEQIPLPQSPRARRKRLKA
jgi:hypothetical protein